MRKIVISIQALIVLTLILGIPTVLTIRNFVPYFVVEAAIAILLLYLAALIWSFSSRSQGPALMCSVLSALTIAATLSEPAHFGLIESGYFPAIVIIFLGNTVQMILFVLSLVFLKKSRARHSTTAKQTLAS